MPLSSRLRGLNRRPTGPGDQARPSSPPFNSAAAGASRPGWPRTRSRVSMALSEPHTVLAFANEPRLENSEGRPQAVHQPY